MEYHDYAVHRTCMPRTQTPTALVQALNGPGKRPLQSLTLPSRWRLELAYAQQQRVTESLNLCVFVFPSTRLTSDYPSRRVGNRLWGEAEVHQQFVPGTARAVAVPHADVRHRDRDLFGKHLGDEAAEATVDEVVFGRDDRTRLPRRREQSFAVHRTKRRRIQHPGLDSFSG